MEPSDGYITKTDLEEQAGPDSYRDCGMTVRPDN